MYEEKQGYLGGYKTFHIDTIGLGDNRLVYDNKLIMDKI